VDLLYEDVSVDTPSSFQLDNHLGDVTFSETHAFSRLCRLCDDYLTATIDCSECVVLFELGTIPMLQRMRLQRIIEMGFSADLIRWYDLAQTDVSELSSLMVYYQNKEVASVFPQCVFKIYEPHDAAVLPSGNVSVAVDEGASLRIYAREKNENAGIKSSELLSHQRVGVDNTGNVRIWPAEQIFLQCVLRNPHLRELFSRRVDSNSAVGGHMEEISTSLRVLELGGGLTALCGLGLAVAGVTDDVVVTDGHPDCVLNQV
jgi:hypothetical protein